MRDNEVRKMYMELMVRHVRPLMGEKARVELVEMNLDQSTPHPSGEAKYEVRLTDEERWLTVSFVINVFVVIRPGGRVLCEWTMRSGDVPVSSTDLRKVLAEFVEWSAALRLHAECIEGFIGQRLSLTAPKE